MLKRLSEKAKAWKAAFKAGMIAHGCKYGCVVDDDAEEIIPCFVHASEIKRLSAVSMKW